MNAQLLGELLRRPELCTCKRGLALKMAVRYLHLRWREHNK